MSEGRISKCDWEDSHRDAKEDMSLDAPEHLGRVVEMHAFVDSSHSGDKMTRRSHTGVFVVMSRTPIIFYSK